MSRRSRTVRSILVLAMAAAWSGHATLHEASACTRAVYLGPESRIVTGRTMDWPEDMQTELWIMPRGMARNGSAGPNSLEWTSRYGSVVASIYQGGTADGINERGLAANLLYLAESQYPAADDTRPGVSISAWAQYVLDNYATVAEAVESLKRETFKVVPVTAPNGAAGTVHLSLSDSTGDSAIFEYIDGRLVIHHGREFQVMTNSPTYDQQLALNAYWKQIGGTVMLPGTNRAADRFARASFYINAAEQTADARGAAAAVFSVIRSVSVPRGISTPDQPNIASTLWRTVADHKDRVYYFENTASPSVLWVKLARIDFSEGSGTRRLPLVDQPELAGDQSAGFVPAPMFEFLTPDAHPRAGAPGH